MTALLALQAVPVIPQHPFCRAIPHRGRMVQQSHEIVVGVDAVQLTGVDKTEKHIASGSAIFRFEKQWVLPVQNGLLQGSFTGIVVYRCARDSQEAREPLPPFEHVFDSVTQARVRLDFFVIKLRLKPPMKFVHDFAAVRLVVFESLLCRQLD